MESAFIRQRNITFDRYVLLTTKQTRGESIEHFFGKLKELSENCELGSEEDTLIRDLFIANMLDPEIQRELLRETLEPAQALRLAINMELGQRNQLQITNSQSAPQVNAVTSQRPFRPPSQRPTTSSFTRPSNQLCRNCGLTWSANHKVKCIARAKTCNNCGLQNHFSRVCRKPKSPTNKPNRSNVNSVEETPIDQTVNAIENVNYNPQCESDYDSSDDNMVASIASNAIQIEPKNTILQIGNTHVGLLIDSGSVCSILPESLASEILENSPLARWLMIAPPQKLKTFSNEPINVTGMIQAPIESNGWRLEEAEFVVVRHGLKPLVGRDLFDALGISVTQIPKNEDSMVNTITTQCPLKTRIAKQFPQLITRIGRSKIHIVKSKFHQNFRPKQQEGRRVPINLQERVYNEIKKLLEEEHIEKLNNCSDQYFISPIVITVKRDQTIKLALDSKTLNKAIHKNKYQMPNIETLMDSISQIITNYKTQSAEQIYFSTIDLKYAYSQLNLHPETAKHCNFNIVSGDMTGTYRFKTGFYGLTDMPAEFQKAMYYTLIGLKNTFCFLDDILIVSKGSEDDHFQLVLDCLKKLDADNLRINLPKCHFAKQQISWLGYNITQSGISPPESKTSSIMSLQPPTTLKKLRSYLGSVHYISKFIPNLAQLCHPLRPLLRKSTKYIWTDTHTLHFNAIKTRIANHTENIHYNPQLETRIKCDASRSGLGAALEQLTADGWKPISFASRFLNVSEERYSINELELLGVVWSIEDFKNYLYGKEFTVITDHRALLSILKEHRSNKSYNSRLSRWVDRLLPYQFSIEHLPGAKMGLVDYISRNPYQPAKSVSKYDEEFLVATLSTIQSDAQLLQRKHNLSAHSLHKLYIDVDGENQNSTTNTAQVLTINYVTPNPQTKIYDLLAPRNNSSKFYSKQTPNSDIYSPQRVRLTDINSNLAPRNNSSKFCSQQSSNLDIISAQHVRLTNNSSNLAAREYNSNVNCFKSNHPYSTHAPQVHLTNNTESRADQKHNLFLHSINSINCTSAHDQRVHSSQNDSVFAHTYPSSKVNFSNLSNTTSDLASRVRFSFNKLTPARHNTLLFTQKTRVRSSDDSLAKQVTNYPIHSKFTSHSLPFTINPVQIESQILVNTSKASLALPKYFQIYPIKSFSLVNQKSASNSYPF